MNGRGFTYLEALTVAVIVFILASLAGPPLMRAVEVIKYGWQQRYEQQNEIIKPLEDSEFGLGPSLDDQ